jgi:Carboxypeptidase regulatory-like domain
MSILNSDSSSRYASMPLKAFFLASIALALLVGQSFYGSVRGAVRDQNGGTVPNIRVTLLDESTGAMRTNVTTGSGEYVFRDIVPSTYAVTAGAGGFSRFWTARRRLGTSTSMSKTSAAMPMSGAFISGSWRRPGRASSISGAIGATTSGPARPAASGTTTRMTAIDLPSAEPATCL